MCLTFSAGLAVLLCFSIRRWDLSLDCEERKLGRICQERDGVTRKEGKRDGWLLFWMLFNTRSSISEYVLLGIYILSNILLFGRLNIFRAETLHVTSNFYLHLKTSSHFWNEL